MNAVPGSAERLMATELVHEMPKPLRTALVWADFDLSASVEHLIYTVLRRQERRRSTSLGTARAFGRLALATVNAFRHSAISIPPEPIAVLVTQPVHLRLYETVGRELAKMGAASVVVDAETRRGRRVDGVDARLIGTLRATSVPSLATHVVRTTAMLESPPRPWVSRLGAARARLILDTVCSGLPLLALDAARIDGLLTELMPSVLVCFSESGQLARLAPAIGHRRGVPVVDLPHAEAADPSGAAGIGYDGVAVFGPRAAEVMRSAGIDPTRIREIGPLGHDDLVRASPATPIGPRRILFASQPVDPERPALRREVIQFALECAAAAAAELRPSQLVVVPHPTQRADEAQALLAGAPIDAGVDARVEAPGSLHDLLRDSWLLFTASSQSVFDAVLTGVPAVTVRRPGDGSPVSFARDGMAFEARSLEEARRLAADLTDVESRRAAVDGMREALGARIGPLDGQAAARAAAWLLEFAGVRSRREPTIGAP